MVIIVASSYPFLFLTISSLLLFQITLSVPASKFDYANFTDVTERPNDGTPKRKIMIKSLRSAALLKADQWMERTKTEPTTAMAPLRRIQKAATAAGEADEHSAMAANRQYLKVPIHQLPTKTTPDNGIPLKSTSLRIRKLGDASPTTVAAQVRFTANQQLKRSPTTGQKGTPLLRGAPSANLSDPLQMTRENCRKMERYAALFGVSDPSEWVRGNCFLVQMYVRVSCEDIGTFVSSCSKFIRSDETEENKKGGAKVGEMRNNN